MAKKVDLSPQTEPDPEQEKDDKALAVTRQAMIVHDDSEFASLLDTAKMNHLWRVAQIFAGSAVVPEHFQGHVEDCFIVTQMAVRMSSDPLMFMQATYIVHGHLGMNATLAIALINKRGPFTGPIQWRFDGKGETRCCTAYATHATTNEVCEVSVDWKMVVAEGWASKSGSKWKTLPDLMFRYRTATFMGRLYCPEVLMGMSTVDELRDIDDSETMIDAVVLEPLKATGGRKPMKKKKAEIKADPPDPAPTPAPAAPSEPEPTNVEKPASAPPKPARASKPAEQPAEPDPVETLKIQFGEYADSKGVAADKIDAAWKLFVTMTAGVAIDKIDDKAVAELTKKLKTDFDPHGYVR